MVHDDGRGAVLFRDLARGTGVFEGVFCDGFQGGPGAFLIMETEQSFAMRVKIGPAGLLQNDRPSECEVRPGHTDQNLSDSGYGYLPLGNTTERDSVGLYANVIYKF